MQCGACGSSSPDGALVCEECGEALSSSSTTAAGILGEEGTPTDQGPGRPRWVGWLAVGLAVVGLAGGVVAGHLLYARRGEGAAFRVAEEIVGVDAAAGLESPGGFVPLVEEAAAFFGGTEAVDPMGGFVVGREDGSLLVSDGASLYVVEEGPGSDELTVFNVGGEVGRLLPEGDGLRFVASVELSEALVEWVDSVLGETAGMTRDAAGDWVATDAAAVAVALDETEVDGGYWALDGQTLVLFSQLQLTPVWVEEGEGYVLIVDDATTLVLVPEAEGSLEVAPAGRFEMVWHPVDPPAGLVVPAGEQLYVPWMRFVPLDDAAADLVARAEATLGALPWVTQADGGLYVAAADAPLFHFALPAGEPAVDVPMYGESPAGADCSAAPVLGTSPSQVVGDFVWMAVEPALGLGPGGGVVDWALGSSLGGVGTVALDSSQFPSLTEAGCLVGLSAHLVATNPAGGYEPIDTSAGPARPYLVWGPAGEPSAAADLPGTHPASVGGPAGSILYADAAGLRSYFGLGSFFKKAVSPKTYVDGTRKAAGAVAGATVAGYKLGVKAANKVADWTVAGWHATVDGITSGYHWTIKTGKKIGVAVKDGTVATLTWTAKTSKATWKWTVQVTDKGVTYTLKKVGEACAGTWGCTWTVRQVKKGAAWTWDKAKQAWGLAKKGWDGMVQFVKNCANTCGHPGLGLSDKNRTASPSDDPAAAALYLAQAWFPYLEFDSQEKCGPINHIVAQVFPYTAAGRRVDSLAQADVVEIIYTIIWQEDGGIACYLLHHPHDNEGFGVLLKRTTSTTGRCSTGFEFVGASSRGHRDVDVPDTLINWVYDQGGIQAVLWVAPVYDALLIVDKAKPGGLGSYFTEVEGDTLSAVAAGKCPAENAAGKYVVYIAQDKHANYFHRDVCEKALGGMTDLMVDVVEAWYFTPFMTAALNYTWDPIEWGVEKLLDQLPGKSGLESCGGQPHNFAGNVITNLSKLDAAEKDALRGWWRAGTSYLTGTGGCPGRSTATQPDSSAVEGEHTYNFPFAWLKVPSQVTVPKLTGLTKAEACAALARVGLQGDCGSPQRTMQVTDSALVGKVAQQDPASGKKAARGSVVKLTFGVEVKAKVPSVVGKTPAQAQSALTALGLAYRWGADEQLACGHANIGKVVRQGTAAGKEVVLPHTVLLYKGVEKAGCAVVKVPAVVGKTPAQAQSALGALGLTWTWGSDQQVPCGHVDAGKVVSQSPAAGTEVALPSSVTLRKAVEQAGCVTVPNVWLMETVQANSVVVNAGLGFQIDDYWNPSCDCPGDPPCSERPTDSAYYYVIEQVTAAGIRVPAGTVVHVYAGYWEPGTCSP